MGHAVKNLNKHSCMVETQCEQIARTQSLILDQINNDNLVTSHIISTRSGKETHEPKGPAWYDEEQAKKRRKS